MTARCNHLIFTKDWGKMQCSLSLGHTDSNEAWDHAYTPTRERCDMNRAGYTTDRWGRIQQVGGKPIEEWLDEYRSQVKGLAP